jgi:hypothetical protein
MTKIQILKKLLGKNFQKYNQFPEKIKPQWIIENRIYYILAHPSVMYRKSCIEYLGGYNESLTGYPEDFELWIRALINKREIRVINDVLLMYRCHPQQLSRKMAKDKNDKMKELRKKLKNLTC